MKRPLRSRQDRHARKGLTLLEVLVALTIFTIVSVTLFSGLASGDRVRGRSVRLQRASRIAANLVEQIRAEAQWGEPPDPGDSTYEEAAGSTMFEVVRTVHDTTHYLTAGSSQRNREITIRVRTAGEQDPLVRLRLVQGYLE